MKIHNSQAASKQTSFVVLITAVIPLLVGLSCSNNASPTNQMIPANTDNYSVYDGTYAGTFNYDFKTLTWDADKQLPGGEIEGPWQSASIGITITFRTSELEVAQGWVRLAITSIKCDDAVFGTGDTGVIPGDRNGVPSFAFFPVPPDKEIKTGEGVNLVINFPNGSYLYSCQGSSNFGTFSASADGKVLSFSCAFTSIEDDPSGAFSALAEAGPFSPAKDYPDYFVMAKNWTLVKIAS